MKFVWLSVLGLFWSQSALAQIEATLPKVPDRVRPLPDVPKIDSDRMPLIGFGYKCTAAAGEGDFALQGTIDVDPDGGIGFIKAQSGNVLANPDQVVAKGERSKKTWLYIGTLRWQLNWLVFGNTVGAAGPYIRPRDARLQFELTPEAPMAGELSMSLARGRDAALVVGGYRDKGLGSFGFDLPEFLDYGGSSWLINKWPYQGTNIAIKKRYGFGSIRLDRVRAAVANIDGLNRRFGELLADYKNLCEPEPYYESNDIII